MHLIVKSNNKVVYLLSMFCVCLNLGPKPAFGSFNFNAGSADKLGSGSFNFGKKPADDSGSGMTSPAKRTRDEGKQTVVQLLKIAISRNFETVTEMFGSSTQNKPIMV